MKWAEHPNLRKRPRAPSKGRGPVQRAIRRAFAASDTEVFDGADAEVDNRLAHGLAVP